MKIIIMIKIMNFEYICEISLNAMQIKVSSAVAYDFNRPKYAVRAPPCPVDFDTFPTPPRPWKNMLLIKRGTKN